MLIGLGETMEAKLIELTGQLVAAYVSRNAIPISDIPKLISIVRQSLTNLGKPQEQEEPAAILKPAVPIKKSVTPEFIICLEDGKKLKMLKRHLASAYGLTPDEYRKKWDLPDDYPIVAPNYAKRRSELALKVGLGRRQGT
ncbi:MAG: MucR family transcriptional regulator [Rhodospirillaceae bacterium]